MADPYPAYARLRDRGAVHRVSTPFGGDAYLITRYAEARAALNDPRLSKHPKNAPAFLREAGLITGDAGPLGVNMLSSDPPDHTRLRRVIGGAFTARRVLALRPRIQRIADDLLAALPEEEEADLIEGFAFPLPITVISEMLGVPGSDRDRLRTWSRDLITTSSAPELRRRREAGAAALTGYLSGLVAERRKHMDMELASEAQPDLISALILAADRQGELDEAELLGMLMLLLVAGHETTVNLIGNGTLALLRAPEVLGALVADPGLVPAAVEELLRYDGPVERATLRTAVEDVDVDGVTVPAGSLVVVALACADRDPARFDRPDELDLGRRDNQHLAFGYGPHFCLGAPLARLEGTIAFTSLLGRFPGIRLARPPEELRWCEQSAMMILRGLEALPVILRADPPAPAEAAGRRRTGPTA
ncbi:cytochrome P450 [Nonomuraea fuscirosea]|uniref:cytochrome P450 family protein n=1 Tax=Nonomuraea fuscirosea TaxID=1291556 RepID=UPI002DDBE0ED|nr:cytochrome P450 [Nonomuraea fuscirosea]WSA57854.1 cytochrome P450 [Nonomuraea fuscirosea]